MDDPASNPVMDYQYQYDKTDNIKQKATEANTYDYQYDTLQRLTEAKTASEIEGWSYDPNGNRLSDDLNPGTWIYDENDRLTESPGTAYQYDQAGNTIRETVGPFATV